MDVFATEFSAKAAILPEPADQMPWWKEPVFAVDVPGQDADLGNSPWALVISRHRSPQGVGCSA